MAQRYNFAVLRLAPQDARQESLNLGIAVFAETGLDIRLGRRLEKIRAISAAIDTDVLKDLLSDLRQLDAKFMDARADSAFRVQALGRVGPLSLSGPGLFTAEDADAYERRVQSILKAMVEPEPATARQRQKRSGILTEMKRLFRQEKVLAKPGEDLTSHRILTGYELDEGLVADMVLKNGKMHVVETVDASGADVSVRKAVAEIGVAALVLERARMEFGQATRSRLVYNASEQIERVARPCLDAAAHQGAELINWASATDRRKFVIDLSSLATPLPSKRRGGRFSAGDRRPARML